MRRLRGRIALAAAVATAVTLGTVLVLAPPGLERYAMDHDRERLLAEARLMGRLVEGALFRGTTGETLDPAVDEAARELHARVTIIALDGRVIKDSAVSALATLENHGQRPEVRQALSEGVGSSVRRSATVNDDRLYAAVAVRHDGRIVGVSRASEPLADVKAEAADLRRTVAAALAIALLVATVLSTTLSGILAGPLAVEMEGARQLAAGKLVVRIPKRRQDELGELAGIVNDMADALELRLEERAWDHARTEAILAAVQEGVLAVDHRGIVRLANEALCHRLGLKEPMGHHYLEVVRQLGVVELVEAVLTTGEARHAEVALRQPLGLFAVLAVPLPAGPGVPHGAVLSFRDLSAH